MLNKHQLIYPAKEVKQENDWFWALITLIRNAFSSLLLQVSWNPVNYYGLIHSICWCCGCQRVGTLDCNSILSKIHYKTPDSDPEIEIQNPVVVPLLPKKRLTLSLRRGSRQLKLRLLRKWNERAGALWDFGEQCNCLITWLHIPKTYMFSK